jgi:hypothetical protein
MIYHIGVSKFIPVSFSSFFLDYFARFFLFETKTNSTNGKTVNFYTVFTRRTIDNIALFLWFNYSFLLSDTFCILKAL